MFCMPACDCVFVCVQFPKVFQIPQPDLKTIITVLVPICQSHHPHTDTLPIYLAHTQKHKHKGGVKQSSLAILTRVGT